MFELLRLKPEVNQLKEHTDNVKKASKDIKRRQRALQDILEVKINTKGY